MTYQITLSDDGTQFCADAEQTILQAALAQGIRLPYGCNNGLCFGCLQEIASGETEYREPVSDVGDLLKYQTMTCKAYATSDLVLKTAQLPDLSVPEAVPPNKTAVAVKVVDDVKPTKLPSNEDSAVTVSAPTPKTVTIDAAQPGIFPAKVVANVLLCDDTRQIDLRLPTWVNFQYVPGQYVDVVLDSGERRSFSIAEYNAEKRLICLYIKRIEKGVFTGYVFEHLLPETIWRIEAPLGGFVLHDSSRPLLMLATSTGIAPMQAMLLSLNAAHATRRVHLYWGQRYAKQLYADDKLTQLALSNRSVTYTPVVSRPGDEQEQGGEKGDNGAAEPSWQGRSGYVQQVAVTDFGDLSVFDIYAAGSPAMIAAVVKDCLAAGARHEQLYLDVFSCQTSQEYPQANERQTR